MDWYLMQVLYDIFQIPFVCWGTKGIFQYPGADVWAPPVIEDDSLRFSLEEQCDSNQFPVIYLENELIFYGIFRIQENQYCSFGPVARYTVGNMIFE